MRSVQTVLAALVLAGCAGQSSVKSAEVLDPKTGVTLGVMRKPLAFVETGPFQSQTYRTESPSSDTSGGPGVVYLGVVEWDRMGHFTYGLWIGFEPGSSDAYLLYDMRTQGAVNLKLDDGVVVLAAVDLPQDLPEIESSPYYLRQRFAHQRAYFAIDLPMLKRMAATQKIVLSLRGQLRPAGEVEQRPPAAAMMVDFVPKQETYTALKQYMHERNIADD